MSENAMNNGLRGIGDDWWAFHCIGYQFYDTNYEDDTNVAKEKIHLPWDYNETEHFWWILNLAAKRKAIEGTVKFHKQYPNLSVRTKKVNLSI